MYDDSNVTLDVGFGAAEKLCWLTGSYKTTLIFHACGSGKSINVAHELCPFAEL